MTNKTEVIDSAGALDMSPIEITPLGSDGASLHLGLVISSEVVNSDEVALLASNDPRCNDNTFPVRTCFEICG